MKRLGKWLLIAVAALAGLVALVLLIGLFGPSEVSAVASVEIAAPQQVVYDTVANLENVPKWSKEVTGVRLLSESPKRYLMESRMGAGQTEIVLLEPPRRMVSRMAGMGMSGEWDVRFAPAGAGTRVETRMTMKTGNPIFRFFALFMDPDREEQKTLQDLKRYLERKG